ncbi:hypothetical protein HELRODRAFT_158595 [Helobdella robusta]|uniref:Uncharacterized protein n=1 Tax=Helobdella robusta TaxID=6412 RepID=T1EMZ8_HELRO|nr:hypothetical protein HELRODRAFT_158595 [Helobdella robusta]ESO12145.1 hypothetical protein HELRODRAFT_158595 [Helobdella robusta]
MKRNHITEIHLATRLRVFQTENLFDNFSNTYVVKIDGITDRTSTYCTFEETFACLLEEEQILGDDPTSSALKVQLLASFSLLIGNANSKKGESEFLVLKPDDPAVLETVHATGFRWLQQSFMGRELSRLPYVKIFLRLFCALLPVAGDLLKTCGEGYTGDEDRFKTELEASTSGVTEQLYLRLTLLISNEERPKKGGLKIACSQPFFKWVTALIGYLP